MFNHYTLIIINDFSTKFPFFFLINFFFQKYKSVTKVRGQRCPRTHCRGCQSNLTLLLLKSRKECEVHARTPLPNFFGSLNEKRALEEKSARPLNSDVTSVTYS